MGANAIETRHLRSALEFAVLMAREAQKRKPPMDYPSALRKYVNSSNRIPTPALAAIRRAIENDERFRRRIAAGALPELVDPIGRVWLERPDGWEAELARLADEAEREAAEADAATQVKRAEKRRSAAEQAAARSRAEVVGLRELTTELDATIEGLRHEVAQLSESLEVVRAELAEARTDARHARDREAAALARRDAAEEERAAAADARDAAEDVRDDALADRAALAAERSELAKLAAQAESLAAQLAALTSPADRSAERAARRSPLPLPGGVLGDSAAAADHLMRSGASILVDGYNVAKLGWPSLDLAEQRRALLDAVENLVRRCGSDVTVVFDGAEVIGATADRRRVVRVVFSPPEIIADDVIRDEVARLPATRAVVVVTNDQAIVRDVRSMGANTMASDQLIGLLR